MNYLIKEKRDYSPFFDLHFIVELYEGKTLEFSFPVYDSTKPFTEEDYLLSIKSEIDYEISQANSPQVVYEPVPLSVF